MQNVLKIFETIWKMKLLAFFFFLVSDELSSTETGNMEAVSFFWEPPPPQRETACSSFLTFSCPLHKAKCTVTSYFHQTICKTKLAPVHIDIRVVLIFSTRKRIFLVIAKILNCFYSSDDEFFFIHIAGDGSGWWDFMNKDVKLCSLMLSAWSQGCLTDGLAGKLGHLWQQPTFVLHGPS